MSGCLGDRSLPNYLIPSWETSIIPNLKRFPVFINVRHWSHLNAVLRPLTIGHDPLKYPRPAHFHPRLQLTFNAQCKISMLLFKPLIFNLRPMPYVIKGSTSCLPCTTDGDLEFVIEWVFMIRVGIPVYQINNASYPNAIVYFERLLPWVLDTSLFLVCTN